MKKVLVLMLVLGMLFGVVASASAADVKPWEKMRLTSSDVKPW